VENRGTTTIESVLPTVLYENTPTWQRSDFMSIDDSASYLLVPLPPYMSHTQLWIFIFYGVSLAWLWLWSVSSCSSMAVVRRAAKISEGVAFSRPWTGNTCLNPSVLVYSLQLEQFDENHRKPESFSDRHFLRVIWTGQVSMKTFRTFLNKIAQNSASYTKVR
jgi:hypothetical protein